MNAAKKAAVLLSGGLDSAVTLFYAKREGYDCHCLAFDYGQRHAREIAMARRLAAEAGATLETVKLPFTWKGSSLVDDTLDLPRRRPLAEIRSGVPTTYVPARNTVFLSIAASFAEAIGARAIFIGAHQEDASGYPDCRKEYLDAFDAVLRLGTKAGLEGRLELAAPLIGMNKRAIIELGASLGVSFGHTWSCYEGGVRPCGTCDSCILRAKGFEEAGIVDPLREGYHAHR